MKKVLLILALATATPAFAADPADPIARAKELEKTITSLVDKVSPAYVVIGGGSGVVISPDGYMLTNHHVAGSKPVGAVWRVKIASRGILDAKVIGHDPYGDITLLKLDGKDFTFVPIGDSDAVKVGDYALALGNPFGYAKDSTPTVTQGVVSAIHRNQGSYSDAIQTDAPINPGNSGGPLINMKGELVGINGRIAVRNGVKINTGVGYAIPTNQIQRFLDSFKKDGIVHHGVLSGLGRVGNTREGSDGAVVNEVTGEAESAGFKKGDVIIEADGRPVSHASRLFGILGTIPAGENVRFKVKRGDETVELAMKLASQGGDEASGDAPVKTNGAYLGIRMKSTEAGTVQVEEVVDESPAAAAGLKTGDVITHFGKRKVTNVNELVANLARRKPGDKVVLTVVRDGKKSEVTVTLGKRAEEK